jgi:hypothetical protein
VIVMKSCTVGPSVRPGPGFEPTGEALFETGVPNNSGGYSDPKMDTLINETHTSSSLAAFDAYANYTATQVPDFWLPFGTAVVAVRPACTTSRKARC